MGRQIQLLFVTGPMGADGAVDAAGKTARASLPVRPTTCAATMRSATAFRPRSCACRICTPPRPRWKTRFDPAVRGVLARLCCHEAGADSPLGALCAEELAVLVRRIFDSWDATFEELEVPDSFAHTVGDLGEALKGLFPGLDITYDGDAVVSIAPSDTVRTRYGWFQRYDVLRDLSTIHARWEQTLAGKRHPLRAAIDRMRGRTLPIKCLETALAWVLFEGLELVFSQSAQLNVLDYRLLYVVLIGTLYGLDFWPGCGAAGVGGFGRELLYPVWLYLPGSLLRAV